MSPIFTPTQIAELEKDILAQIDRDSAELISISRDIHRNPEIAYQERHAAELLTSKLAKRGFEVERSAADIETAFIATTGVAGAGRPTIAILAEYDALRGLGHACGHNLIGTAALAAGWALKAVSDRLPARIQVVGTPAEEGGGGKVLMTNRGVFDEVSAAMMFHPLDRNAVHSESLASTRVEVEMFGKPAHAAAAPHEGINALDAIIALYNNINALRQHLRSDTRIHGIITNGGQAPNIVPEYASAAFSVRAADRPYADHALAVFKRCAEAAALAHGARLQLKVHEASRYDNMIGNPTMEQIFSQKLSKLGIAHDQKVEGGLGSTDMGNVSQKVPSIHPFLAIAPHGIAPHTNEFREAAFSDEGQTAMLNAARAMALTALELIVNPEALATAKREFAAK
jgi:amidohydrolase